MKKHQQTMCDHDNESLYRTTQILQLVELKLLENRKLTSSLESYKNRLKQEFSTLT